MKTFVYWFLAVIITLSAAVYQRKTGPTYPQREEVAVNGEKFDLKLVRSLGLDEDPRVWLAIEDEKATATLFFKKFNTNEPYVSSEFTYTVESFDSFIMNKIFGIYEMKGFSAIVPQQPPAGKLQYYVEITDDNGTTTHFKEKPVVIRFKGSVPSSILTPHILFMFFAMLLSTLAGLMAIGGNSSQKKYGVWTLVLLLAGGMVLGPLVQYYAFGELWTGVPFGWDLTDNKTLLAVLFWVLAVVMNHKKPKPLYTIIAAVALLLVYSIPHSLFGSELNYESGEIIQGFIINFSLF